MYHSKHLRKPSAEFRSRSLGSGLDLNNNPLPTIKQEADNSNARLVAALVGLALLFCIYLYFLFRPIIKDKNCVTLYDSARNQDATVTADLEKGTPQRKSEAKGEGEKQPEADVAAHLEKRQLRQWIHRASRGRFFSDSKAEGSTQANRGKTKKRARDDRNKYRMPTICVSPPPPIYGSDGIKIDPICCLSDSHSSHQPQQEYRGGKALVQCPTHTLLVPTNAARPEPKPQSPIQSPVSGNTKTHVVHTTKNPSDCGGSETIRTILSRSSTM